MAIFVVTVDLDNSRIRVSKLDDDKKPDEKFEKLEWSDGQVHIQRAYEAKTRQEATAKFIADLFQI